MTEAKQSLKVSTQSTQTWPQMSVTGTDYITKLSLPTTVHQSSNVCFVRHFRFIPQPQVIHHKTYDNWKDILNCFFVNPRSVSVNNTHWHKTQTPGLWLWGLQDCVFSSMSEPNGGSEFISRPVSIGECLHRELRSVVYLFTVGHNTQPCFLWWYARVHAVFNAVCCTFLWAWCC